MIDQARKGRCYELAGRYAAEGPDFILCHGTIAHRNWPPIGHAWVATDEGLWEPISETTMAGDDFVHFWNPQLRACYNQTELAIVTLITGHWGPWVPEPTGLRSVSRRGTVTSVAGHDERTRTR